jgi:pimeloyl-ACP methyl ester carboxylesterase
MRPHPLLRLCAYVVCLCAVFLTNSTAARACDLRRAEVSTGTGTIPYLSAGPADGEAVLLLHGLFAQKEQWQAVICALADAGYQPVAPDLPGYGQSRGYDLSAYPLETQAQLLKTFVKSAGLRPHHIAGNSMGGAIAALYAHDPENHIHSLAFIGGTLGIGPWAAPMRNSILGGNNPFIPLTPDALEAELRLLLAKPPTLDADTKQTLLVPYQHDTTHYIQVWNIVNLYGRVLADGPNSAIPTLILWGDSDEVFDVASRKILAKKFLRHTMQTLPDTGHLPMVDNPTGVSTTYLAFLKRQQ